MKKVVFASVLALATTITGIAPALFAQNAAQSGQLTIKDPAEYNAYTNAVGQPTPQGKAAAIEDFLQKYPNSVVKNDLLESLMRIYQPIDTDKAVATAKRLLAVEPNNLRAIFVIVYNEKQKGVAALQSSPPTAVPILDEAAQYAQQGLNATKPPDLSDGDFEKLKTATAPTFDSAIAVDDEAKKDNPGEIQAFTNELKASDPSQTQAGLGLNDTLLLAEAYAQATPPDYKNATWFFTRAAQFAPPAVKPQIEKNAEYFYNKFHGGMDGYPAIQALAQSNLFPPAAYNPTPAPPPPSPADLAAQTVAANSADLKSLSLSDKEFILDNGKPEDAQKVWDTMKGVRVGVPGKVIAASTTQVQLAVTEDNQQSNKADFTITMKPPLKTAPAIGATVTYDATFDSYTTTPPMITLVDGAVPPKAPVHHRPTR